MRFLLLLFFCQIAFAQDFKPTIQYLASDSLHGRAPGTSDEKLASEYIEESLPKCYHIHEWHFYFLQDSVKGDFAINIVASNKKDKKADSTIILMAHYDGLGVGSPKSLEILEKDKNKIHNGADDNASGVAMVVEIGKWLAKQKKQHYKFILLFTSAHEAGLFGAENFVKQYNMDSLKIKAVLNFDMVGRLDKISTIVRISSNRTNSSINDYLKTNDNGSLKLLLDDANIHNSDLRYFERYKIPLFNFTTGIHDDYHKSTDDESKINYNGMKLIYLFMIDLLKYFNH